MGFFSKSWAPVLVLLVASLIAISANAYEALYAGHVPVIETEPAELLEEGEVPEEIISDEADEESIPNETE
jgi:hypothetical protein